VDDFARFLAEEFNDQKSLGFYRLMARRIREGKVKPDRVKEGFKRCRNRDGGLRNRAAAFNAYVYQRE
jgi:hypothetical protein